MNMTDEIWATEDITVDATALQAVTSGMLAQMPGFEKVIEEMQKVKGVPVLSVNTVSVMGNNVVSRTELLDYSEGDAPAGTFEVPEGYKKVDMGMGGF